MNSVLLCRSNLESVDGLAPVALRANISETGLVLLINEQKGEKEEIRDEREFSWCCSFPWRFGCRGTERRLASWRAAAALCLPRASYYRVRRKTSFPEETVSRPLPAPSGGTRIGLGLSAPRTLSGSLASRCLCDVT